MRGARSAAAICGVAAGCHHSWMVVECGTSLWAASRAHSLALVAFGSDSLIELLSAGVLILLQFSAIPVEEGAGRSDRRGVAISARWRGDVYRVVRACQADGDNLSRNRSDGSGAGGDAGACIDEAAARSTNE